MAIGLCTSKLGGSVGPGRSFSAVNLPRDSIKTAMGSMERFLLERAWKMLHPREKQHKGQQTQIKVQAWECFEVRDGTLQMLKSWVVSAFRASALLDVD